MINRDILSLFWVDLLDDSLFLDDFDVIVDGGVGLGAKRTMGPLSESWIKAINSANIPVMSIDVPSGLCPNRGLPLGCALVADTTITFIAKKTGFIIGQGLDYIGNLIVETLGVDTAEISYELEEININDLFWNKFKRSPTAHKGSCGKVVVIGGQEGLLGAAILASEAALKMGAGYVKLWTVKDHVNQVPIYCPDIVVNSKDHCSLEAIIAWADAVLLGPGLGRSLWSEAVFDQVLSLCKNKPLVLDADALYWLAKKQTKLITSTVLTPHSGEAGVLVGEKASFVQRNRIDSVNKIMKLYSADVVLKGAGTLLGKSSSNQLKVCQYGDAAMATAGMGDVLSGMIVGSISQLRSIADGVEIAVTLHAKIGEDLSRQLSYGLIASDVVKAIPKALNEFIKK